MEKTEKSKKEPKKDDRTLDSISDKDVKKSREENFKKRESGVPPESNDDYDTLADHDSADSFPASDPPGNY